MALPYELVLGWRYTRAGRSTRRNGFISFISGVSMLGIALVGRFEDEAAQQLLELGELDATQGVAAGFRPAMGDGNEQVDSV